MVCGRIEQCPVVGCPLRLLSPGCRVIGRDFPAPDELVLLDDVCAAFAYYDDALAVCDGLLVEARTTFRFAWTRSLEAWRDDLISARAIWRDASRRSDALPRFH